MVVECMNLLLTIMMQVDTNDVWRWIPDSVNGYTARTPLDVQFLRLSFGGRMSL